MYHNKRKGTDLRRITVECLFCNLKLNRENFETHRKRHHKNDPKCQYAIVNDGKQSKLNFGKSSKGEEEDVNVPQPHTVGWRAARRRTNSSSSSSWPCRRTRTRIWRVTPSPSPTTRPLRAAAPRPRHPPAQHQAVSQQLCLVPSCP